MDTHIVIDLIGGTAEVAEVLGCPKQQIYALRRRADFPKPFRELASTPLWNLSEIREFKGTWKRRNSANPVNLSEAV
jgi:predicted DNA-binding transcriptional regulator AlpA